MDVFENLVIITGANKGLGEALFNEIYSDKNINLIISVSRNLSLEQEKLLKNNDKRFRFIKVDLSKITNIKLSISSFEHFYKNYKNVTLISNAGIIGPIKKVGDYNDEEGQSTCKSCPSRFYCDSNGMIYPLNCPVGKYCPPRVTEGLDCLNGTYGNTTNFTFKFLHIYFIRVSFCLQQTIVCENSSPNKKMLLRIIDSI